MLPDLTLDPTFTEADIERAHTVTPYDYDAVFAAITAQLGQDDLDEVGSGLIVPATKPQAISNAQGLRISGRDVGVGYCLRVVREDEWRIPGLYPDAETATLEARLKHPETDPGKIPRGASVVWLNGRFGHIALSVGGGMCLTTDYARAGRVDFAPIGALASWCGGRLFGWIEDVNGIDCWPNTPKPVPRFTLEDRIAVVHGALVKARRNHAGEVRIEGLEAWLERLRDRRDQGKAHA